MNIVITGNTKGFGLALTKEFLKAGDNVMISSRDKEKVKEVVHDLKLKFPKAIILGFPCDVSNPSSVLEFANFAFENMGSIEIWINNAGTSGMTRKPLSDVSDKELERIVNTNLLGTLYGCKIALSLMKTQNKGHVFNIAGWGSDGRSTENSAAYGATKASIPQLTKTLVEENKNNSVGIHTISPGMMMTDLVLKNGIPDTKTQRIFNIICEYPEIVAKTIVPKIRTIKGTGSYIRYLKRRDVIFRFLTARKRKNRFFDHEGNFIPYLEIDSS